MIRTLQKFNTPQAEIEALGKTLGRGQRFAEQTPAEKLRDGQILRAGGRELEVIHTPGHTQGSISLRFGRYLFSGDHVLPTISPNIGAGEMRTRRDDAAVLEFARSRSRDFNRTTWWCCRGMAGRFRI